MKAIYSFVCLILLREATGAVVRKPPAFAKPVYSDSYLPAAMQVIFHSVEQLKILQCEEASQKNQTASSTSISPVLHIAQSTEANIQEISPTVSEVTRKPEVTKDTETGAGNPESEEAKHKIPEAEESSTSVQPNREPAVNIPSTMDISSSSQPTSDHHHQESPEMNEETPEANYATPESNYESQEANEEVPEENEEDISSHIDEQSSSSVTMDSESSTKPLAPSILSTDFEQATLKTHTALEVEDPKKKEPTIESIVEEIYEIVKPTPSGLLEEDEVIEASKSSSGMSVEKTEILEEEEEETRFTLLGEKVAQVPRPSLSSYLRRSKVPPNVSLQQLASLYDALSKDARKQGFGKYTGYSDEVLKTLETSAEGGVGPQLKTILKKVLERNELTREDARMRTSETIRDLDNPSSVLNKDLRRLLPLRYTP